MSSDVAVPPEAEQALRVVSDLLQESLVAVYLHGSAVTSGLRQDSDVDLLVILDRPIDTSSRVHLVRELMNVSGRPRIECGVRPIELTIVLSNDLQSHEYPVRHEFLYGEWLRAEFEAGVVPEAAADPDLTLVLAQAHQSARSLLGPEAQDVLPIITQPEVNRAIGDALPALLSSLEGDERNVLLTLARMWRTVVTGDFVSKNVAAEWAIDQMDHESAAVLADARAAYLGSREDDWSNGQQDVRRTADLLHAYVVASL